MRKAERKKYRIIILVVAIISFILGRCSVSDSSEEAVNTEVNDTTEVVDSTSTSEDATQPQETTEEEIENMKVDMKNKQAALARLYGISKTINR